MENGTKTAQQRLNSQKNKYVRGNREMEWHSVLGLTRHLSSRIFYGHEAITENANTLEEPILLLLLLMYIANDTLITC